MIKTSTLLIFTIGLLILCSSHSQKVYKCPYDLISWLRMKPDSFGCMLQRNFNYHDKKFHCGVKGMKGDFDGPDLPPSVLHRIHPDIKEIKVHWEHADLKEVWVTFDKKMSVAYLRDYFFLPKAIRSPNYNYAYGNLIEQIWYRGEGDNHPEPPSIDSTDQFGLSGFEHQGPGD
jgi:hypothetical protein